MRLVHTTSLYDPFDVETKRRFAVARATWDESYRVMQGRLIPAHQGIEQAPRSSLELGDARRLPYVRDFISFAFDAAQAHGAEAVMITNADTCLIPSLFENLFESLLKHGCYYSHRVDHQRIDAPLSEAEALKGAVFPGADLFAFTRSWWDAEQQEYPDLLFGAEAWDGVLKETMRLRGFIACKPIVYHEMHGQYWAENLLASPAQIHNRKLAHHWIEIHGVAKFLCRPEDVHGQYGQQAANGAAELGAAFDLIRAGRDAEAEDFCRQILKRKPDHAWAMHLLGVVARQSGRMSEAIALMQYSIQLQDSIPEFHNNLGTVEAALGQKAAAERAFRRALALQSDHPQAATNLANVLREQRRLEEAERVAREAVLSRRDNPEAHNVLGTIAQRQGKSHEALACFESAVRLKPDYVQARVNRASALLMHGDFQIGWREYEWRLRQVKPEYQRKWSRSQWDGSDPRGKVILVHCEGGFGNIIQFLRFASHLKGRGARVILECPRPLMRLVTNVEGIDRIVEQGTSLPHFDYHIALMSLPAAFGTTLDTIPSRIPYLQAEADLVAHVKRELARCIPEGKFKVGIAWQGNPNFPDDATRSIPLGQFMPLAKIHDVFLINLQHGPARDQAQCVSFPVLEIPAPPEPEDGAMVNAAALISQLDLVITSDTSIAHLAGGLGRPVWVALSIDACWRWLRGREDSPWYPTMRLFRQNSLGNWHWVFAGMSQPLATTVAQRAASGSVVTAS